MHHTKLQINGPSGHCAFILIFILLQKSSGPLQSDRSSPLLSNLLPLQSCKCSWVSTNDYSRSRCEYLNIALLSKVSIVQVKALPKQTSISPPESLDLRPWPMNSSSTRVGFPMYFLIVANILGSSFQRCLCWHIQNIFPSNLIMLIAYCQPLTNSKN